MNKKINILLLGMFFLTLNLFLVQAQVLGESSVVSIDVLDSSDSLQITTGSAQSYSVYIAAGVVILAIILLYVIYALLNQKKKNKKKRKK